MITLRGGSCFDFGSHGLPCHAEVCKIGPGLTNLDFCPDFDIDVAGFVAVLFVTLIVVSMTPAVSSPLPKKGLYWLFPWILLGEVSCVILLTAIIFAKLDFIFGPNIWFSNFCLNSANSFAGPYSPICIVDHLYVFCIA